MLLTRKSASAPSAQSRLARGLSGVLAKTMDRRAFLKRSGVAAGAGAFASQLPFNMIGKAEAAGETKEPGGKVEVKRTVCTHCSVGCAIDAVVQNGVWVRQEPVFDSPLNLGGHCAKGASVREHGMTENSHRLKSPMKLEGGKWKQVSWDRLTRKSPTNCSRSERKAAPTRCSSLGSSKHNNEQSYLLRKWIALWGSNNIDHQARICHSTTVAGIANTWGYGAMTNSYNDEQNSKCLFFLGSNAAEAHPVSMLHTLHAKENGAKVIVADPRFTRTAAHADKFVRIRSGSDVAFQFGLLYHIFKNGWEDKQYIHDRVYGMDKVRAEVMAKYTPQAVEEVTGVSEKEMYETAKMLSDNRTGIHHLGDGTNAAHQRQRDHPRQRGPDARARQCRPHRRRLQHLPRPRQRAGCDRHRPERAVASRLLRAGAGRVETLGARLERRSRLAAQAFCQPGDDGQIRLYGFALGGCRAGEKRKHRPGFQFARCHLLGPCAEFADARSGPARGDEKARSDGRASIPIRRRARRCFQWCERMALTFCRRRRSSRAREALPRRTARCSGANA